MKNNELNFEYKGIKCCIALHKGLYTAHVESYKTMSKTVYKNIGSSKSQIEALQIIKRQVG